MSSSDALKWLNENFNFVDSVTIIDHSGTIIAKQRFNPRYTDEENAADNQWALGKNLLEVFPGQNFRSSALLAALKTDGVLLPPAGDRLEPPGQEVRDQQPDHPHRLPGTVCRLRAAVP